MSVDLGAWLEGGDSFARRQAPLRAQIQWSRIQDNPVDIKIQRKGQFRTIQTVRVEWDNSQGDAVDQSGDTTIRRAIVYGIQGHPELPDTDIRMWDVFVLDNVQYTVTGVNKRSLGSIKAYCDATG